MNKPRISLHWYITYSRIHRVLKKMREGGVLVPGAPAGRKGSGCFKLSAEEKERRTVAQRAAAKKLKAQQKSVNSGEGKLHW